MPGLGTWQDFLRHRAEVSKQRTLLIWGSKPENCPLAWRQKSNTWSRHWRRHQMAYVRCYAGFLVFLKVLVVWRWSWLVTPNSEQSAVTWCAGGARNRSNRNLAYRLGGTLVWLDSPEPSNDVALRCLATGGQKADPLMPGSADCSPQDCAIYWRWSRETYLGSVRPGWKNCKEWAQYNNTGVSSPSIFWLWKAFKG